MQEIPFHIMEKIESYEDLEIEGIRFYPIRVREFKWLQQAQPAIDFLQQSLPVRYLSVPLLSAFYAMDYESRQKEEPISGLFSRALLFLVLALKYKDGESMEARLESFGSSIVISAKNPSILKGIEFEQDGERKRITPILFQRIRPILAAQNGIELTSEDANPELVEAERDIEEQNGPQLEKDFGSLLSTVAAFSMKDESELLSWPVLKFVKRKQVLERAFGYLLCGLMESNGATFKGGNPVPSLFYNRARTSSNSLVEVTRVTGGKHINVSDAAPSAQGIPTV